jgi:hypothetical protein
LDASQDLVTDRNDSLRKASFSTAIRDGDCRLVSQPYAGSDLIGSATFFKYNTPSSVVDSLTLTGDDLKAFNSFEAPERVVPQPFEKPTTTGTRTRVELPPRSYSMLLWSL